MTGHELIKQLARLPADILEQPVVVRDSSGSWNLLETIEPYRQPVTLSDGNYIALKC